MNTSVLQLDPPTAELLYGSNSINVQVGISGSLLLICGSQLMFFGFRCFRSTLMVVGFLILGSLTWIGLANSKPMEGYSQDDITMFIVPLSIGIIGAMACFYFWKLSMCLIAVLGGLTLALYICCWRENLVIPSDQGRIGFFIGCPLLMLLLSKWKEKTVFLFSLSFSGSFAFILGIDLLAHTGYVTSYWHMLAPQLIASSQPTFTITRLMYIMQCATLFVFLISFLWQSIVHYHDPAFGSSRQLISSSQHSHDIEQQTATSIPRRYSSLMAPPLFRSRPHTTSSASISPTSTQLDYRDQSLPSITQPPMTVIPSPLAHPASNSPSSSLSSSSSSPITPSTHSVPLPSAASSSEIPSSSDESLHDPSSYPTRSVHTL